MYSNTLSAILTNSENPSLDLRLSLWAMEEQKSLARVEESTSKAWKSRRQLPFFEFLKESSLKQYLQMARFCLSLETSESTVRLEKIPKKHLWTIEIE